MSYRQLQLLAGRDYDISWIDGFNTTDTAAPGGRDTNANAGGAGTNFRGSDMGGLIPPGIDESVGRIVFGPGEHPFPSRYAIWHRRMRIEPSIYLDALVRDFLMFGGRLAIRAFDTARDLMALDEPVIVNLHRPRCAHALRRRHDVPSEGPVDSAHAAAGGELLVPRHAAQ